MLKWRIVQLAFTEPRYGFTGSVHGGEYIGWHYAVGEDGAVIEYDSREEAERHLARKLSHFRGHFDAVNSGAQPGAILPAHPPAAFVVPFCHESYAEGQAAAKRPPIAPAVRTATE
jgi:hypothetical protein